MIQRRKYIRSALMGFGISLFFLFLFFNNQYDYLPKSFSFIFNYKYIEGHILEINPAQPGFALTQFVTPEGEAIEKYMRFPGIKRPTVGQKVSLYYHKEFGTYPYAYFDYRIITLTHMAVLICFAFLGFYFLFKEYHLRDRERRLKLSGQPIWAKVIDTWSRGRQKKPRFFYCTAKGKDDLGVEHLFVSDDCSTNLAPYQGRMIRVYVNANNFKSYYVDFSSLTDNSFSSN